MISADEGDTFHAETREQWRAWLAEHAAEGRGVWLVTWKQSSGRPVLAYEDAVREALAVGWIDSRARRLDDDRSMIWFTARKRRSGWARTNKQRVEELEAAGLMTDAGRRVVEAAQADGSWTLLDDVEDLVVPPDLEAALDAAPGARERWEALPPSARRAALGGIALARTAPTRARRIAAAVRPEG